jgi:hypothetical protein
VFTTIKEKVESQYPTMLRKMAETKTNEASTASPTASPTALSTFLSELKKRKSVTFEIVVDNPNNGSSMQVYRKPARVKAAERWVDQTFQEEEDFTKNSRANKKCAAPFLPQRRPSDSICAHVSDLSNAPPYQPQRRVSITRSPKRRSSPAPLEMRMNIPDYHDALRAVQAKFAPSLDIPPDLPSLPLESSSGIPPAGMPSLPKRRESYQFTGCG